jgi:hypothetical protein
MRRLKVAMKILFAALALVGAVAPALAAVDVSADTVLRPYSHVTWYWWFSPMVRTRCRGSDSAAMSAWFTVVDKHDSIRYRDSLGPMMMGPGDAVTLTFAPHLAGPDSGRFTARCSVAAPGDTNLVNDVITKPFIVGPPG